MLLTLFVGLISVFILLVNVLVNSYMALRVETLQTSEKVLKFVGLPDDLILLI